MKVLIGDVSGEFAGLIGESLKAWFKGRGLNVTAARLWTADDIRLIAGRERFDLFILVLNNIIYGARAGSADREKDALGLVRHLRETYNVPIIAMEGSLRDPAFGRQALDAGADFFFLLPFKVDVLCRAVEAVSRPSWSWQPERPGETPDCVRQALRNWEDIAFCAYEGYVKAGPVAIHLEEDGSSPSGVTMQAVPVDAVPVPRATKARQAAAACDADNEVFVRFHDTMCRPRERRLRAGRTRRGPRRVYLLEMLRRLVEEPEKVKYDELPGWLVEAVRNIAARLGEAPTKEKVKS